MDVREAVKQKENYNSIVTYFTNLKNLDTDQLVVLIDVIDAMSEEVFEHYMALQVLFRNTVKAMINRRLKEGSFAFLTDTQQSQLSYAMEKAGSMGILLWEKYEVVDSELKKI